MDRASIRWASTLVAMASAVPLVGCMRHAVKSAFEDDFRCPVASDVSDMGNDRYPFFQVPGAALSERQ